MSSSNCKFVLLSLCCLALAVVGCAESMVQPKAKVDRGIEEQLPPYSGPKARVAVARFDWKVGASGSSQTTITGVGSQPITITHEHSGYMAGLRDMLTTTLVQSKRYRVLERQDFGALASEMALGESGYADKKSTVKKGSVKGADLLIVAAVTGWEPGTSGTKGGILGGKWDAIAGIAGAYRKSSMAMDIRIIDVATSEVLAATRVEGEASDVNMGALAGGIFGSTALGGGLSNYAKTPMEKAIRTCIYEATKYIIENTPKNYYKY